MLSALVAESIFFEKKYYNLLCLNLNQVGTFLKIILFQ